MTLDKKMESAYVWYSTATDVTGKNIAEALGMKGGISSPKVKDTSLILCWGTKINKPVNLGSVPVLNHPDKILRNRDKLDALRAMKTAGVNVAPFLPSEMVNHIAAADAIPTQSEVRLPVIGRTRFHQGGKGFWHCPTKTHVVEAMRDGAAYFQNLIEIKDEYRLHVVGDKVIYSVKKVKRTVEEMEDAFIKHETERQKALAAKNGDTLDEKTIEIFLRRQAKKFAQDGANMLIRSNRLGWKFVKVQKVDNGLQEEAVKALKALGLDFGAVDCCTDSSGRPWIIEVNTGPGLEGTTLEAWVKELKSKIAEILSPKKADKTKVEEPKVKPPMMAKAATDKKSRLMNKLDLAREMAENVEDDSEAEVLDKVFARMFGS